MLAALANAPLRATPAIPAQPNGPGQRATPAVPAVPPARVPAEPPEAEQVRVLEEVKARLEKDTDFQIIKRTFRIGDDDKAPAEASKQAAGGLEPVGESALPAQGAAARGTVGLELDMRFERTTFISVEVEGNAVTGEFRIRFEAFRQESLSVSLNIQDQPQRADPLLLDLGGEGVTTTGVDEGVAFDITGDGRKEQVSFVSGNSWFLALDRDGNGVIDDGRELFGDQHGAANGFDELARFDSNGDGVIDARDNVFDRLRLFRMDADGTQHLKSLETAGVSAIHLAYVNTEKALNEDDLIAQVGRFQRTDGSTGQAVDVLLGYRALA